MQRKEWFINSMARSLPEVGAVNEMYQHIEAMESYVEGHGFSSSFTSAKINEKSDITKNNVSVPDFKETRTMFILIVLSLVAVVLVWGGLILFIRLLD